MDSSTGYLLAKALQHEWGDTWNHVVLTLCAACSWVGHDMGWPALLSGSVVAGTAAGEWARADGSASGGSVGLGYGSSSTSDLVSESYPPMQYSQPFPDPIAALASDPIDPVYQALVKHLERK